MTEAEWQSRIVDYAQMRRWRCYHTLAAQRSNGRWVTPTTSKGFPDWLFLRGGDLVVLELKTRTGRVAPEQRDWIDAFQLVQRVTSAIVRPTDWRWVEDVLR